MLTDIVEGHDHSGRAAYLNYPLRPLIIFDDLVNFSHKSGFYVAKSKAVELNGSLHDIVVKHYIGSFQTQGFYPISILSAESDDDSLIFSAVERQLRKTPVPRSLIWVPAREQPYLVDVKDNGAELSYADYYKTSCKKVLESQSPNGKKFVEFARSLIGR